MSIINHANKNSTENQLDKINSTDLNIIKHEIALPTNSVAEIKQNNTNRDK
jgi:hypothetical protein